MSSLHPEQVILQTKKLIESDKRSEIRLNANGGNSILIVCEPKEELIYLEQIEKLLDDSAFSVIDLNRLLVEFVDNNRLELEELFELLKGSVHQIFKAPEGEESEDLFKMILHKIEEAFSKNKVPILTHTGTLHGSGIENIHIMEHPVVMKSNIPLIILYPATSEGNNLLFLTKRQASKYRCMIINE
jgi:hypothetical protein